MDSPVLHDVTNGVGHIRLNRPKALNSLNTPMVDILHEVYASWTQPNSGIRCIIMTGEGGKAFCAGGDVKWVVQEAVAGRPEAAADFFAREYQVNGNIGQLKIPHIALLDGIVMGGGAGLSMHGHFRVATEKTVFAMPEVAIGLFPDVGMMHRLVQLPGALGSYLALSGARLTGVALKDAGLATHYLPSQALPGLISQLQQLGPRASDLAVVNSVLTAAEAQAAAAGQLPGPSALQEQLPSINRAFGDHHRDVAEVLEALEGDSWSPEWSSSTRKAMLKSSPLSAAVTWTYLHRVKSQGLNLNQVLLLDLTLAHQFSYGRGDFYEGVRARLIDKDDAPKWKHGSVKEVSVAEVEAFFQPLRPGKNQTESKL